MEPLKFFLWNVGHGLSATIITPMVTFPVPIASFPRRRIIQIDAANNTKDNFSPIKALYDFGGIRDIDCLVISHPDLDHIGDLPTLHSLMNLPLDPMKVHTLLRNESIPQTVVSSDPQSESQAKATYKRLDATYKNHSLSSWQTLSPNNFAGLNIWTGYTFYNPQAPNINDNSVMVIISFGQTDIIMPGDLTLQGLTDLVSRTNFPPLNNQRTLILVAPHHGSETVDPTPFLNFFRPNIVLASEAWGNPNTSPAYSSDLVAGYPVLGEMGNRKLLTTKQGSHIEINAPYFGQPTIKRL